MDPESWLWVVYSTASFSISQQWCTIFHYYLVIPRHHKHIQFIDCHLNVGLGEQILCLRHNLKWSEVKKRSLKNWRAAKWTLDKLLRHCWESCQDQWIYNKGHRSLFTFQSKKLHKWNWLKNSIGRVSFPKNVQYSSQSQFLDFSLLVEVLYI